MALMPSTLSGSKLKLQVLLREQWQQPQNHLRGSGNVTRFCCRLHGGAGWGGGEDGVGHFFISSLKPMRWENDRKASFTKC